METLTVEQAQKMSRKELETFGFKLHHTALSRGYVPRNTEKISTYKGKFGEGFTVMRSNVKSSRYCSIAYYVK
jgi:hypothetical protein